jgi:alkanesulfonate monooxygenase SsuD/methylene tetrahydromethanopterin reductase-like flavin-dependent oxidoreductase (luciferase family)
VRYIDHLSIKYYYACNGTRQRKGGARRKIGILTYAMDIAALAKQAEELGFDSFWAPEHTTTPVHIAPMNTTYRLHLEPDGTP